MEPIIWSNVEISVGIICACLPLLRPVFQAAKRRLFRESTAVSWHSFHFLPTADEIKQSLKVQSPSFARRAEGYLVMPEKDLPDLPAAADFGRYVQKTDSGSPEKEDRGLDLGKDNLVKGQVRAQEYDGADVV